MKFLKKLQDFLDLYTESSCGVRDNAFLYEVYTSTPPLAKHIVFASMPEDVTLNLISAYKHKIPTELLDLYKVMNGANLFWKVRFVGPKNTRIPYSCLSIYGVPLTWDREHIEPFNICIEDLNRPKGIPDNWLKFGAFNANEKIENRLDLFVDTTTNTAFAVEHNSVECCVSKSWNSIDDCLCDLFDLLCCSEKHKPNDFVC